MNRRLTYRSALGVALGVAMSLSAVACGTDTPSEASLSSALEASGLSPEVADCAAAAVIDNLSDAELADLVERGASGAPEDDPDRTDDSADQVREALASCRAILDERPSETTVPVAEGN